ncbi:MAG TPA: DUF167 domain-containing protein [Rubrivivax sp.]|nr:DUF167 domain-containing protein [Rubrivivax sp.]
MTPGGAITIEVSVRPNARHSRLLQADDGSWQAQLKAPPVDGKANAELIALVARHFGCAKSAVAIKSGAAGRRKRVTIATC